MRKSIIFFIAIIVAILAVFAFASCCSGNNDGVAGESRIEESGSDENQSDGKADSIHTHIFDKQVATKPYLAAKATCKNFAKYYFSCECGEKGRYTFESGELANHNFIKINGKPATCTEIGITDSEKCTVCGTVIKASEYIPALGHDIVKHDAKEPTCTAAGYKAYETCTRCDYTTYEEVKAAGHNLITHEAQNATCENIGWAEYVECSRCDYSTYSEIPATGHDYDSGICKICDDIRVTDDNFFVFTLLGNDTYAVAVNKNYASLLPKGIRIPDSYNGKKVTAIVDNAFVDCKELQMKVVIPSGVTRIGASAFYDCANLTDVKIPDGVTVIGESAFYHCSGLIDIILPSGLEKLSKSVLSGCGGLKSITLPSKLKTIGEYALSECGGLTTVDIPESVTAIDSNAFLNCGSLTTVTGCKGVVSFGESAFRNDKIVAITVPDVCEKIGAYCFNGMSAGATITVNPTSLKSIGESAIGSGAYIIWNSDETTKWKIAYKWTGYVYSSATYDASYHYGRKNETYYLYAEINRNSAEKTYRSTRNWARIYDCTNHNEIGSYFSDATLSYGTWIRQ